MVGKEMQFNLISEAQLEKKGCKIVSKKGIHTVSKGGKSLFYATMEHNFYVYCPMLLPTSSIDQGSYTTRKWC